MSKINERLEGVSQEKLYKAQKRLDALSKKYGLEINLESQNARWRELCLRIIGIPYKKKEKSGRKERKEDEVWEIGNYIDCIKEFDTTRDENYKVIKKGRVKAALYEASKNLKFLEGQYENGKKKKPEKIARAVYYNKFPKLKEKLLEEQKSTKPSNNSNKNKSKIKSKKKKKVTK